MSKKCVCGHEMTLRDWSHEWVCPRCGRKKPIVESPMFTVFSCRKCEHLLFVEEDSAYYQSNPEVNMFDVYGAFTQQITDMRDKGKDIINCFEKTLLLRQILEF